VANPVFCTKGSGYFPRGLRIPPPLALRVKNGYSPSGPLYPVLRRPLPLPLHISGRISNFTRKRHLAHVHLVPDFFAIPLNPSLISLLQILILKKSLSFRWHNFEYRTLISARTWKSRVFLETA
jgi:hypothetical protein